MSSDLFLYDDYSFRHSPQNNTSDLDLEFLTDPKFSFSDPSFDALLQAVSQEPNEPQPSDPNPSLSVSPPSQQMHDLSLDSSTLFQPPPAPSNFYALDTSGVKLEGLDSHPSSLDASNYYSIEKFGLMQRSLSSHSLDQKPSHIFQPRFSSLSEHPKFQSPVSDSYLLSRFGAPIRRTLSTGDLQRFNRMQSNRCSSSPLATENTCIEENGFKVGRYSAEERKQKIHKYRCKRHQRNFNKTIKYACRKTLADSRPRVRGRFARNDEPGEIPKAASGTHREEEDEEELWVDDEEVMLMGGGFANATVVSQFQYFGA